MRKKVNHSCGHKATNDLHVQKRNASFCEHTCLSRHKHYFYLFLKIQTNKQTNKQTRVYLIETKLFYSNIILILTLALQLSVSGYERICTCRRKYFRLFLCSEYLHLQIVKPSQQKQKTSKQINKQINK